MVSDELPHKNYVDRIFHNFLPMLELDVPVLAICFGFQLLFNVSVKYI